jgi:hypothetical protein
MDYLENRLNGDVVDLIYEKLHKIKYKDTLEQIKTYEIIEQEIDIPDGLRGIFTKMTIKSRKPSHSRGKFRMDLDKSYLRVSMKIIEPKSDSESDSESDSDSSECDCGCVSVIKMDYNI